MKNLLILTLLTFPCLTKAQKIEDSIEVIKKGKTIYSHGIVYERYNRVKTVENAHKYNFETKEIVLVKDTVVKLEFIPDTAIFIFLYQVYSNSEGYKSLRFTLPQYEKIKKYKNAGLDFSLRIPSQPIGYQMLTTDGENIFLEEGSIKIKISDELIEKILSR